jgi:hypothetical protein
MLPGFIDYLSLALVTINSPNETVFYPFSIDPSLLAEGTNVLAAEVHQVLPTSSDLGLDFELLGTVAIATNQLPTVTITNPPNYALVHTPVTLVLGAIAGDPDGTIRRVEFFTNHVKLGEDLLPPYIVAWVNPPPGNHVLTAVATDNGGATNTSAPVNLVVNRAGGLPITLAPFGAVWRYLDNGSDQGTAWAGTNFNDNAWFEGPAELGYGDGDEATLIGFGPDPNNKFVTTYFRHSFTNTAVFSNLIISLVRDDGAVVYLNGVEVFRSNMPGGAINYLTFASSTVNAPQESQVYTAGLNPALLRRGKNVLAVEVHQRDATSSDLSFNLELAGLGNLPPVVTLTAPANNTVLTAPPNVPLAAVASDSYGSIARVEFFAGTTPIGSDTNAPYNLDWQPAAGTHVLSALATDNHGGTNRSASVLLTILPPPTLIAALAGNTLTLAWPATANEFALESTDSLDPPPRWSPVTNAVLTVDGLLTTTLDANAGHRFFRLIRP